jgi:hypothetical protein
MRMVLPPVVAAFTQPSQHRFACTGARQIKPSWSKLQNGIPIDDEELLEEMDRIAAEGGDPFFLTPESWDEKKGDIEEVEQPGPSKKLLAYSVTENDDSSTIPYATDGRGPAPRLSSPQPDAWKSWDGTVDEDAHMD